MRARIIAGFLVYAGCVADDDPPSAPLSKPPAVGTRALCPTDNLPASPSPISGGSLLVTKNQRLAIASDPDTSEVHIVDLAAASRLHSVPLCPGDRPGRAVEDGQGRAHVVVRNGAIATIDLEQGAMVDRRTPCAEPRGIDYDEQSDQLVVACAGGELATMPAERGASVSVRKLPPDLRDVVISTSGIFVSRFKSAQVLLIRGDDIQTIRPPWYVAPAYGLRYMPRVAWRMVERGEGVALLHQQAQVDPLSSPREPQRTDANETSALPPYYAPPPPPDRPCEGQVVLTMVSAITGRGAVVSTEPIEGSVLAVDLALGDEAYVAIAGAALGDSRVRSFDLREALTDGRRRLMGEFFPSCISGHADPGFAVGGYAVAVAAYGPSNVVLFRNPTTLAYNGRRVLLSDEVLDEGHTLFHIDAGEGIACASCHPEGDEDGHTWHVDEGLRRTPSLLGGLSSTVPFHWEGELLNFEALTRQIFEGRMAGRPLSSSESQSMLTWIDAQPTLRTSAPDDADAVERGRALFFNGITRCGGCHNGPRYTNNQSYDVGTGGKYQVPSLSGVAHRAPFMHHGCAATLEDRFGPCGGGEAHGNTSHLSAREVADMVAFMKTL